MHADRAPRPIDRRAALKAAACAALVGSGLVPALARGSTLFDEVSMRAVLQSMGGEPIASDAIDLELPDMSEDGALVPVTVASRIPGTTQIALLVELNPYPLAVDFGIPEGTEPFVATRVKLAASGTVTALVKADGRWYSATRETAVTVGGCGG